MKNDYLIDTHCHLHDLSWFTPAQQTDFLVQAHQSKVQEIICIGTNHQDSLQADAFAALHTGVYWTYGIHPEFASQPDQTSIILDSRAENSRKLLTNQYTCATMEVRNEENASLPRYFDGEKTISESKKLPQNTILQDYEGLKRCLAQKTRLVAIGEIGLDYHYEGYDAAAQIRLFERLLQLAVDLGLPVTLHIRNAFADVWPVLDNFPSLKGVIHSFTGSKKDLKQALSRDFYIGVNGLITYNTISLPPLEKIVLETDAPFLTPVPFRGTINMPGYVSVIAAYLSNKLGEAEEIIVEQTTKNARELFKI